MLSAEAASFTARAIIQCIAGNKQKVEEYCGYLEKAIEIHKNEPKWVRCKYWINGQKIEARIDWNTQVIVGMSGEILRRGKSC